LATRTLGTRRACAIVVEALRGAGIGDVVRTRTHVTDSSPWREIGRAHAEAFGSVRPAATMVQVQGLIHPDLLVEVEVDAIVGSGG
jgi:enamine deaminase RidA (YjgF/YER057c/UK114 family)